MQILILISLFFSFIFIFMIAAKALDERLVSNRRIKIISFDSLSAHATDHSAKKQKSDYKTLLKPLSSTIKRGRQSKKWENKLRRADIPLKGEEFIAIWFVGVLLSAMLIIINVKFLFLFFIASVLPPIYIQSKITKRLRVFDSQLNDTLGVLANSLRAGFSFFQAMDTVRKEMPDPISKEFGKTLKEINFGTPVEEALRNMSERVGSQDLDLVVTAVLIQRQVGGNMAEILETISQTIRDRIKILGEIKTLTAQGKISGYIIGSLPIILLLVLSGINPEYTSVLYTSQKGIAILAGGAFSQILGIVLIKKIINIEV